MHRQPLLKASQAAGHFVLWLLSRVLASALPVFYTDMRGGGGGGGRGGGEVADAYISLQTVKMKFPNGD